MDDFNKIVRTMFFKENLTIGEIAGALGQDPKLIYEIVYRKKRR